MMTSYFNLLKYAATGQASPDMTYFDKLRASTLMGGSVQTLTGIPPLSFKSDGTPLISWSMKGNGSQQGTPTPDNPVMPEFVGVRTGNLCPVAQWTNDQTDTRYPFQALLNAAGTTEYKNISAKGRYSLTVTSFTSGRISFKHNGESNDLLIFRNDYSFDEPVSITISFYVEKYDPREVGGIVVRDIMLNLGRTALPYEPFGWAEKITCAGQTVPVYLGQVSTVRRIKKLVLTGNENFAKYSQRNEDWLYYCALGSANRAEVTTAICTHVPYQSYTSQDSNPYVRISDTKSSLLLNFGTAIGSNNVTAFKSYIAAQYANGTPVTVWYVLATPETAIVNEPLCKIGDYADELHSTDAAVTIPTAKGQNVLTVDTPIQPSEMTITYKG